MSKNDNSPERIQLACQKLKSMLEFKQESSEIKTLRELANAIQFYCEEGVEINEDHVGGYLRKRKNGTYIFPSIEKLRAIGLYLGYELGDFYDLLFENSRAKINENYEDLTMKIWMEIKKLDKSHKKTIYQFMVDDLINNFYPE